MSTPAPAGQPELTGQVMFYRRPEPLSLERHRDLGVKQIPAPFSFLRQAHAVPITVSEFGVAATCYPIIFVGNDKTPVAVMGVRQNENEYVDANGVPDPDAYLPAFARRYPFVFAADPKSERLLLCVDTEAQMVSNQPDVKFFEGEQASQFTQDAIEFCKEFERQRRATADFVKMIRDMDLFEQKTVAFQPRDTQGNEVGPSQKVADYWAISEERLNALAPEKYLELRNNGALGACYAHLVSLLNWSKVIQRAVRTPPPGQAAA